MAKRLQRLCHTPPQALGSNARICAAIRGECSDAAFSARRPHDVSITMRQQQGGLPGAAGALRNAARESSVPWSQYETVPSRAAPLDAPPPIARRICRFPGVPGARGAEAPWRSTDPLRADALCGPSWSLIRSAQSLSRSNIARLLSDLILFLSQGAR